MRKVALITGGGRGIGAATAQLAAQNGYDVCISYVSNDDAAAKVVQACKAEGARALAVKSDVGRSLDVDGLFAACDEQLGPVSLLVTRIGGTGGGRVVVQTVENLRL